MIVAAAIRINGLTMSMAQPSRHHDILSQWFCVQEEVLNGESKRVYVEEIKGFLTDKGEFLNRSSAYKHAIDCGQGLPCRVSLSRQYLDKVFYDGKELFSEDLW